MAQFADIFDFGQPPLLRRDASRQARLDRALWEIDTGRRAVDALRRWLASRDHLSVPEQVMVAAHLDQCAELVRSACEDVRALRDELAQWRDNIAQYFSHTDKYRVICETEALLSEALEPLETIDPTTWKPDRLYGPDRALARLEDTSDALAHFCSEVENAEFPSAR